VLLEGPHLLAAALQRGLEPLAVLATERALAEPEIASLLRQAGRAPVIVTESLFRRVVEAENPPGIAAEIALPASGGELGQACVFLEGVQDAGNVGAIVRSAAAFGAGALVVDRGCADPWSPKALRAGMGGHFALQLREAADLAGELDRFKGRIVCAVPRAGAPLGEADLSGPIGWLFGSEGRGVSAGLQRRAALRVTIPTTPGTESLNVAAAAAICLYEAHRRRGAVNTPAARS
jgi:TrmH family RNA methyltransferase